jgi:hypothetical protein
VSCIEYTNSCIECVGWKLGWFEVWWLGVFIASTIKVVVGESCCRRAHRTVRCANHVTQPLGFDRWSSDKWGHRTVRWCTGQVMFTVRCAFRRLLWLCALSCTVHCSCSFCRRPLAQLAIAPLGTPDSPVNYSGEAPQKLEASKLELIHLVHRTHSGALDQGCLRLVLLLSIWTLSWTFY